MGKATAVGAAALVDLGGRQRVIEWGWFRLSLANAIALLVLITALVVGAMARMKVGRGPEQGEVRHG